MIYNFPTEDKKFFQNNRSNVLGNIWSSFNLDFQSNLGVMRVAPRLKVNTSTADDADLGLPVAFWTSDTFLWGICGSRVFKNGTTVNAAFTEDASTGAKTDYDTNSDLATFNSRLWAAAGAKLVSKALNGAGTGAWTERDDLGGSQHPLVYFKKFNRLYYQVSSGSISSIDSSDVVNDPGSDYAISLDGTAACMRAASTSIWIGLSSSLNTSVDPVAVVYEWDGISAQITNKYFLRSRYVVAMVIDNDVPVVLDGNGILSKLVGGKFQEIGRLPFSTKTPLSSYVCKNGMTLTKDGTILVVVNNQNADNAGTINENLPSGVWEWSEENGFTHKYAFTYNPSANSTITDYGQNRISASGAIYITYNFNTTTSGSNGTILVGSTYFTNSSSTSSAIFFEDTDNTVQKKGYFVTDWLESAEIADKFLRLWTTFRRFLDSNDTAVFKYRLEQETPTYADITWVNTTSFTTTTDITAYGPTASGFNGTVGGEVEVIQGTGSGSCVHITSISSSMGTYTVTVDTAVTGVTTGTAKARFQKWLKLFPSVTGQVNSYADMNIGGAGRANPPKNTRIQLKGCMTFTGNDEFHKLALFTNPDINITA